MFALFFLHFVPFFSDWLNFVAQELKPKEKIYLVNKLHASCRLSHSAHIKTLRKTITITKRCRINRVFLDGPVLLCVGCIKNDVTEMNGNILYFPPSNDQLWGTNLGFSLHFPNIFGENYTPKKATTPSKPIKICLYILDSR